MHRFAVLLCFLLLSGCVVLEPRAKNPFPGMTRVAVLPFFNQSTVPGEINDLERGMALAYMMELQKIEGFDVVPIGVVDTTVIEFNEQKLGITTPEERSKFRLDPRAALLQFQFNGPKDVLKLAEMLDVDAVVVGTLTYYDPWYPPKIGLKTNWYSRRQWFVSSDNAPCRPCEGDGDYDEDCCDYELPLIRTQQGKSIIRGQNAAPVIGDLPRNAQQRRSTTGPVQLLHPMALIPVGDDPARYGPHVRDTPQVLQMTNQSSVSLETEISPPHMPPSIREIGERPNPLPPSLLKVLPQALPRLETAANSSKIEPLPEPLRPVPEEPQPLQSIEREHDPTKPVMSYTKMFDGKNPEIVRLLRDYVEVRGDLRSGGWEGFMQRTDDYISFCCHTMIIDMLSLHGGALKTKVWLKPRKTP